MLPYVFGLEERGLSRRSLHDHEHDDDEQALMRPIVSLDCSCIHQCLYRPNCALFSGTKYFYYYEQINLSNVIFEYNYTMLETKIGRFMRK